MGKMDMASHQAPALFPSIPLKVRPINGVTRDEWGAEDPSGEIKNLKLPVTVVLVSYTGSKHCTTPEKCQAAVRKLQKKHKGKGYADIKYNFLIGGDGSVYEGRGWDIMPEKNKKYPKIYGDSIEIGVIFRKVSYRTRKELEEYENTNIVARHLIEKNREHKHPPPEMFHVINDLLEFGAINNYVNKEMSVYNCDVE